ncbi:hypothetical protein MPSEU_000983600 [Mayamaea pseudoterrestris]|nr:hypothetical protein MPSEU_000983600 [Mayamaea pseudoterrestris]
MSDYPRGNYRDNDEDGSERSSAFTDDAGYQSSNDGRQRRPLNPSDAAPNNERQQTFQREEDKKDVPLQAGFQSSDPSSHSSSFMESIGLAGQYEGQNLDADTAASIKNAAGSYLAVDTSSKLFAGFRNVGFAATQEHERVDRPTIYDPLGATSTHRESSHCHQEPMGPPLSRIQASSREGSMYGSDDGQRDTAGRYSPFHGSTTSSISQLHETMEAEDDNVKLDHGADTPPPSLSGADDMEEGSQAGGEDDCGNSLDVETHSVHSMGARSVYSQDDTSFLPQVETASIHDVPSFDPRQLQGVPGGGVNHSPLGSTEAFGAVDNSPYQEAFLHAPGENYDNAETTLLKVAEANRAAYQHQGRDQDLMPMTVPAKMYADADEEIVFDTASLQNNRRRVQADWVSIEDQYRHRGVGRRSRSRSRSRSPNQSGEEEGKPAARSQSSGGDAHHPHEDPARSL